MLRLSPLMHCIQSVFIQQSAVPQYNQHPPPTMPSSILPHNLRKAHCTNLYPTSFSYPAQLQQPWMSGSTQGPLSHLSALQEKSCSFTLFSLPLWLALKTTLPSSCWSSVGMERESPTIMLSRMCCLVQLSQLAWLVPKRPPA